MYRPTMTVPLYVQIRREIEARIRAGEPEASGEPFQMKPLTVEVTHEIAFAKVHCPMFGFNYIDYLSFVRADGRWLIVNKLFTDVPQ